jgi:hypothetical protein
MQTFNRSIAEDSWSPAVIETARIINVNVDDWSVDVVSEYANKKYMDLQVMSPYFHFAGGEGIYAMPEIGAMVWVCKPTQGQFGAPFILGFQAPYDLNNANFRDGRMAMNPGDLMLRTRDNNFVILRRGGVVQIGATAICQRMFIPIRNFIKDFCENYELHTFGGDLTWETDRTDQTTTGDAPTKFSLVAKQLANDPGPVAKLTIGSHGQNDPTILELDIFASGAQGAKQVASMVLDNAGNVTWTIQKDWNVTAQGDINFESKTGNVSVKVDQGTLSLESAKDMTLTSDNGSVDVNAKGQIVETSNGHVIAAPSVALGGSSAKHPVPFGDVLTQILQQLLTDLAGNPAGVLCAAPGSPTVYAGAAALIAQLNTLISSVTMTM